MSFVSSRYEVGANDIIDMPISDGLKEALVNCGFTRKQILTYTTGELASILEIDQVRCQFSYRSRARRTLKIKDLIQKYGLNYSKARIRL